jgi:hypothetical protein
VAAPLFTSVAQPYLRPTLSPVMTYFRSGPGLNRETISHRWLQTPPLKYLIHIRQLRLSTR